MQVMRGNLRRDPEESLQMPERLAEELHGLHVLEIPDVRTQDRVTILGQTQGVLQLASAGKNLADRHSQVDGIGSEAARPTHRILTAFESADNGVIHPGLDLPVVQ